MSKRHNLLCAAVVLLAGCLSVTAVRADEPAAKPARPTVEVVFCLDTTGSMGGLIDAAKSKIWAICNQIAAGKPTPRLKVGLVAFRDRGDDYITKVFDLSEDLDAIHGHLMSFKAQGGGDIPESVNQALNESVTKINWSSDKKTLKIIFLVGDAPPHMDYADDVKYPVTCQLACKKDIIINTIQCGSDADCKKYWADICKLAEGSYVQIDQKGGPIVVVKTPFDEDLGKISAELARSTVGYGARALRDEAKKEAEKAADLPTESAAERGGFFARTGKDGVRSGAIGSYDLLDAVNSGKVKLKELKDDDLPEELRKLKTTEERDTYLKKLGERRAELNRKAADLDKKRSEFITKKQAEDGKNAARDSFDNQVLTIIRRQATRANIQYPEAAAEKK
jgi:Mg-chelatase subunit ChlD